MSKGAAAGITREKLINALNEDLSREYQAVIAYVVYSQVLKGAQYMNVARELESHAGEELQQPGEIRVVVEPAEHDRLGRPRRADGVDDRLQARDIAEIHVRPRNLDVEVIAMAIHLALAGVGQDDELVRQVPADRAAFRHHGDRA